MKQPITGVTKMFSNLEENRENTCESFRFVMKFFLSVCLEFCQDFIVINWLSLTGARRRLLVAALVVNIYH